nr:host cell division inhibitor Icd-like protein [Escherichia coli]
MAHKTKATTEGSPVEIKEIKRIIHNAISEAGGQYAVYEEWPLGPDVRIFLRHVLFRKVSSAKASGTSLCSRARALSSLRVNSVALACSRAAFRLSSCSVIRALVCVTIEANVFFFRLSIIYPLLSGRLECCFKKSLRAKLILEDFSNRLRISISAICLFMACFFSTKCRSYAVRSSVLFSDCEVCRVLSILCTCKIMRRTSSHHGADGFCQFHRTVEETVSYQPGGRVLPAFNRRGYLSKNSSRTYFWGFINCGAGVVRRFFASSASSRSLASDCFCRMISHVGLFSSCPGDDACSVIVCTCKAKRRSTSHYSAGGFYPLRLQGYVNIFRTKFSCNTSDHLSQKAVYTDSILYKTGIGRENSSGDSLNQHKKAFRMAVFARPYFVRRFMQCHHSNINVFTVTAATEREARARLPHTHLIFVARIRQGESCLKPSAYFLVPLTSAAIPSVSRRT